MTAQEKLWKARAVQAAIETAHEAVRRAGQIAAEHATAGGLTSLMVQAFDEVSFAKTLASAEVRYWESVKQ